MVDNHGIGKELTMSNNADSKRRWLTRSLAGWGMALLCLGGPGCDRKETFENPDHENPDHENPDIENPDEPSDFLGPYELRMEPAKVTIEGKNYCLRTYNGMFPSPTIEVPKGADRKLRLDFKNKFTKEDKRFVNGELFDFNETNLHTHGLHVRPEQTGDGKFESDNVLLVTKPGGERAYRFDLDESGTHEAGTYWYHPHLHGSTSIQVANGMAGALIIRGDVDELPGIKEAEERIFLLQQIPYDDDRVIPLGDGECTESTLSINDFNVASAANNTLINGVLHPTFTTHKNQVERWRFIHAGITNEVTIGLREAGSDGSCDKAQATNIPMQQIAADGYTFMKKEAVEFVSLQSGNRADVMMQAPSKEGTYCVLDLGPAAYLAQGYPKLLAYLKVDAQEGGGTLPSDDDLRRVAREPLSCDDQPTIQKRKMVFAQQKDANGNTCEGVIPFEDGERPFFNINCKKFASSEDDVHGEHGGAQSAPSMVLPFGQLEEWELSSENFDHPFHIHVNSFTVCPGSTVNGTVIATPRWMDTLYVRQRDTSEGTGMNAITVNPIRIRTKYEDYTGRFVMHCHKLNHEDEGMMQLVEIK